MNEKRSAFKDTTASVLLDLFRGVAAVLVLFGHWRNLLFIDYSQLTAHRGLMILPYALSSAGNQAVVVFFVLSGYLISGSVFLSFERDRWSWSSYLTHRAVRLWVVLVPGLLLCAFWDHLGLHLNHSPALYSGAIQNHMIGDVRLTLSTPIFFGNLFFLQRLLVPTFGSDNPLWSLAYEFWYYLLFPLAFVALRRKSSLWQRVLCGGLFLMIAWFVRHDILPLFPVWLAGTALALLRPPSLGARSRIAAAVLYLPLPFLFAKAPQIPGALSDYLFGFATFIFLFVMLSATNRAEDDALFTRGSRSLARFSYTLYVVHMPFALFLTSLFVSRIRWVPDAQHLLQGFAIFALIMLYAYLVACVTEFRTDGIRRRVEETMRLARKPAHDRHTSAV